MKATPNPQKRTLTVGRVLGLCVVLASFAASAAELSDTVIQPPTPPGLPKAPAIRLPNPPGLPAPPAAGEVVRVEKAPPAAPEESHPAATAQPFPQAVWIPGYYVWHGGSYVWVAGKWERPPEGKSVWVAPRWEKRDGGYVFVAGSWK